MQINLEQIAKENGRYSIKAIKFVSDGLTFTAKRITSMPRHVSGQTLCEGLKLFAIERWGRLAKMVLNSWNINSTRDFGEIVFIMIEHKCISAQPTDSIDDFNDVYDFQSAFKENFKF